ncbi:MAG: hypothetical protein ACRD4X_11670, partial [Candidatus Acidiferrales bacterium]
KLQLSHEPKQIPKQNGDRHKQCICDHVSSSIRETDLGRTVGGYEGPWDQPGTPRPNLRTGGSSLRGRLVVVQPNATPGG